MGVGRHGDKTLVVGEEAAEPTVAVETVEEKWVLEEEEQASHLQLQMRPSGYSVVAEQVLLLLWRPLLEPPIRSPLCEQRQLPMHPNHK